MNGTLSPEALAEALAALLEQRGLVLADDWLSIEEAVKEAGVSRSKLYEWMRHEELAFFDEGDRQIRRSTLLQFKRDREVVMIGGKKVPAQRAAKRARSVGSEPKKVVRSAPATAPRARAAKGVTKESLLAHLESSRKAA